MSQLFAGRKRPSSVWTYFRYCTEKDKSVCTVNNKSGAECGKELTGKNTTKLKTHLSRFHAKEYETVTEEENELKTEKSKKSTEQYGM